MAARSERHAGARLAEGMRAGDLRDVVLPLLSVDEFASKVDPTAIVLAFYVSDRDAARSLNRFVQKSPIDALLDTEVSPAPDQRGYYRVFVELLDNDQLTRNVDGLLTDVGQLTAIDAWQMTVRKSPGLLEFTPAELRRALDHAKHVDQGLARRRHGAAVEEAVRRLLHDSDLTEAAVSGRILTLGSPRQRRSFELLGLGAAATLLDRHGLAEAALRLDSESVATCNQVRQLLGAGWQVDGISDCLLLARADGDDALLLRGHD